MGDHVPPDQCNLQVKCSEVPVPKGKLECRTLDTLDYNNAEEGVVEEEPKPAPELSPRGTELCLHYAY
jgi:hypothetical protein